MSAYNAKEKLKANIEALRIVLQQSDKTLSTQQIEKLKLYSGFGSLKGILFDPYNDSEWESVSVADKQLRPLFIELHDLLKEELSGRNYKLAIGSARNGILTQFFTPAIVPATFYEVLKQFVDINSMYEPSAGVGIFITEANKIFDEPVVIAYEKDMLTGMLLTAIMSKESQVNVNVKPFEESNHRETGAELCISNIPFGALPVYDISFDDRNILSKIHNYFWAKGLTKVRDGGLVAYLVSNMFLDTVTNQKAREYLFMRADFISLVIMPDNLMKDNAGTEAGSHFLVVRKNSKKTELSAEEKLLVVSENIPWPSDGKGGTVMVSVNKYINSVTDDITIGTTTLGKNQYGKPALEVWWSEPIEDIAVPFREILQRDFAKRYSNTNERTLVEIFQELGKLIGPALLNVSDDETLPWEDEEETELAAELLEAEIQANMKDGCLGQEDDEYNGEILINESVPWEEEPTMKDDPDDYDQMEAEFLKELDESEDEEERLERHRDMAEMEMGEGQYQDDVVTDPQILNTTDVDVESVKKMSKKDAEIFDAYLGIKELYVQLEELESEN